MLRQFLRQILTHDPLRFPKTLDDVYSSVINGLRQEFPDLDQCRYSLNDDSPESVACQAYKLFPSHTLKCFQALAITELRSLKDKGETDILAWPSVTLVDIGCGAGAASAALLALLQSYQQFLITHDRTISPIRVLLIGFDRSANMLRLYDQVMAEFARFLPPWLIDVRHEMLNEPFPQGVRRLTRQFQPTNLHYVLLAVSNVIRPLRDSFQKGQTPWWEKIRRALTGQPLGEPGFGEAEASAIRSILVEWVLDRVGLLSIATSGKDDATGIPWHEHVEQMNKAIAGLMSPHAVERKGIRERIARFENPRESWWRRCAGCVDYSTRFYFDYLTFTHESYVKDKQWQSVMSPRNIELAWARARRYALREVLTDEIEISLFDYEVEGKLDRLRKQVLARDWHALNVEHAWFLDTPKKPGETRPKALCRIEEQILGAAIIQCLGAKARSYQKASYSYRLNNRSDEFLYEYWLYWWKRFIGDTHKHAKSRDVLRSDVKGFYQNIEQDYLFDIAGRSLDVRERTERLLRALLFRDCGPGHDCGNGLPQGHIASGFWADLYIAQLDNVFSSLPGVEFARFADDMVFAIDGGVLDPREVKSQLWTALKLLGGLEPSEDKTYTQSGDQYVSETELDELLKELDGDRFKPLVCRVYRLDTEYRGLFKRDALGFVSTYLRLLKLIPIHVSAPWLRRKLEQYSSWRNRLSKSRLQFPPFPDSPEAEDEWLHKFLALNANWYEQLKQLQRDLADLCRASVDVLSAPNSTKTGQRKAMRRLAFAAYRLCVLGLDEVAGLLATEIAHHPWRVPVHLVCRGLADCGRSDLLMQILDTSNSAFVRAWAIRALADSHPTPPEEGIDRMWAMLLRSSSTAYEKLKASEALLFADRWETIDLTNCQRLIEQESNPYLLKNYILIAGRAFGDVVSGDLRRLQENCHSLIVVDVIQYALKSPGRSVAYQDEPDALLRYYSDDYPTAESDTKEEHSPFGWAF